MYLFKAIGWVFSLFGRVFRILLLVMILVGILAGIVYAMQLDEEVQAQFEGKRWALPARVFARPLELFVGQSLYAEHLEQELKLLGYRKVEGTPRQTGQYSRNQAKFDVFTRGFKFNEDFEAARYIQLSIRAGKVSALSQKGKGKIDVMRIEPLLIGNFYPSHNEDRVLVRLPDVPPTLVEGLISVEDKKFYQHQGVNPMAIARAMVANIRAGHTVQGGSTITQQLVKNFFLTNERSWRRKFKEALMAFLLELRYSKEQILEAYLNEIYLGQDGQRAIHGFGLAAQYYFSRPLHELRPNQLALLIGLAKGATYYDPRRHPKRAKARRDLVLTVMEKAKVITAQAASEARERDMVIAPRNVRSGASPFPAYLDVVREQLKRDYREEDLRNEGLLIFTSMDPIVQMTAEDVLVERVQKLEKTYRIPRNKLNAVLIISSVQGGEVSAVVGGRDVRYPGYNRAISAKRQIGSLIKPPVYLAALERPKQYTLATRISDADVKVKIGRGKFWEPGNYDNRDLGYVSLLKALSYSRNTPTVRIGIDVGLDPIIKLVKNLGVTSKVPAYPSLLLGALELSPMEVQQMYQSMAAGGSYSPLRTIRNVMDADGNILTRYPLTVQQVARPEAVDLLKFAMHHVTLNGTAKSLKGRLPAWKRVAGKTGTTNDKKDSWFAGFSGQHVMTVWVGRDDNKPTKLTGASGALVLWGDMMKALPSRSLRVSNSSRLQWATVDAATGERFNPACSQGMKLPFLKGSVPKKQRACAPPPAPAPVAQPAPSANQDPAFVDQLMQ